MFILINIIDQELQLIESTNRVQYRQQQIELTSVEYRLIEELMKKPGVSLSRDYLMDHIYPDGRIVSDRTIDSHIKKLRKKLRDVSSDQEPVQSVYGVGYRFELP